MNEKLQIAIDCRMWDASGIGTYLRNITPRVIRRMPEVQFVLLGDSKQLPEERRSNVALQPLHVPIYSIREQWSVPLAIPAGTSLVWSPHYNVPVFSSVPLLVTIHDALHVAMPELFPGWHKQLYAAGMFRAALTKARLVLTDSHFTKAELSRLFGRFAKTEKIKVIHLGVDEGWFNIATALTPYENPFLLYVGNVKPHKNLRGLVAAFDLIKDNINVDLVIVGEREGFLTGDAELLEEAKKLGERVHFTGRVSFAELQQYYAHAQGLVLPSFYEGFGLTVLEAMAAGCPVAVSRSASLPEVCGDAAICFDPGNVAEMGEAIRTLVENPSLYEELSQRGKQRARDFNWEKTAEQTVAAIREIFYE